MPMNQSTDSTSTSPMAGIAGTAVRVAARMTMAEPGTYTVSLDAATAEGKPIDTTTVVSGRVRGIESQNGVVYLLIGERAVSLATVINARLPETNTPAPPPAEGEADA